MSILLRLDRAGAYLDVEGVPAGSVRLMEPGRPGIESGVLLPAARFDAFVTNGLLVIEERDGGRRLRLSPAAKARLATLKARAKRRRPARKPPVATAPRATRAQRSAATLSPLTLYARKRDSDGTPILTSAQKEAGERLASDFHRAHLMPKVTMHWSALSIAQSPSKMSKAVGAATEITDAAAAARQRVHRALDEVGSDMAGIVVDVCCFEIGLAETEKRNALPRRSGKVVLQLALTRLAKHYGITMDTPVRSKGVRHWGDDDYRPTLDAWRD
jgi:hypothetical protein